MLELLRNLVGDYGKPHVRVSGFGSRVPGDTPRGNLGILPQSRDSVNPLQVLYPQPETRYPAFLCVTFRQRKNLRTFCPKHLTVDGCRCTLPSKEEPDMTRGLTDKQDRILKFIVEYVGEHGYPPSIREIGNAFGISSLRGVT